MVDLPGTLLASLVISALPVFTLAPDQAQAQPAGTAPVFPCENAYEGGLRSDYFNTPLYQGKNGWFFRYGADITDTLVISPDAVAKVAKVSEILRKRGTTLVYMPVPTRGLVGQDLLPAAVTDGVIYDPDLAAKSHHGHVEAMRKAGVVTIDLASALKANPPKDPLFLARDLHWTPEGARWAAQQARHTFDEQPSFADIPKLKFETTATTAKAFTSRMHQALAGVCGTDKDMSEQVSGFDTKRVGATADDLLGGESEISPIALVGTSFSDTPIFNFEGFLSQALESEVANFAVSGGGQYTALYKWALTEGQKPELPKFLVWELPIYNRLDDAEYLIMFRQIIAAAHGACGDANKALPSQKITLSATAPQRIEVPAGRNLEGEDVALRFNAPGLNLERLGLELEYGDGEREILNLRQPERAGAMDTFEIALNDEMEGGLTALTVRGFTETPLNLSLDICDFQGGNL
jgi:alginate biosynthesis protein AlgX